MRGIKWYDYLFALLWANMITSMLWLGFTGLHWWEGIFWGIAAGLAYRVWADYYCIYRLAWELVKENKLKNENIQGKD